jgi:hypothetical protein
MNTYLYICRPIRREFDKIESIIKTAGVINRAFGWWKDLYPEDYNRHVFAIRFTADEETMIILSLRYNKNDFVLEK